MDNIKFSVIIITRNRAKLLSGVLESVVNQNYDKEKYEIIVVDNNSNDCTLLLVNKLKESYPMLKYVYEPEIGMSKARNRGAQIAKGEILAFIDDDGIAESNWLKNYELLYEAYSEFISWGGRIELIFMSFKPKWLTEELMIALSYINISKNEIKLSFPDHPFGCNFSVKREYYMKVGGFIENIKNCNEEKAFFYRLHKNGYQVGYSPKPLVYHRIPPSRLKKMYFIKRGIYQGIGNIKIMSLYSKEDIPTIKIILRELFKEGIIMIINRIIYRKSYLFKYFYFQSIKLGELFEAINRRLLKDGYNSYCYQNETPQSSLRI